MSIKITDNAISVAAIGPDGKLMAFSPNNHRIYIAACNPTTDCSTWLIVATLEAAHNQPISGIAWHHGLNRILSCAHDRTAFVWNYDADAKAWAPQVVNLDAVMTKGCTDCAFVASGDRIVIASAHRAIGVGKYNKSLLWWNCKFATPHAASVTTVACHPTNDALAASGSTDCTLQILCIDTSSKIPEGEPQFGQAIQKFDVGAWVHQVVWMPSGNAVAAVLHSSKVVIVGGATPASFAVTAIVSTSSLPFFRLAALSDDCIVAAGFDFFPVKIKMAAGGAWKVVAEGTQPKQEAAQLTEQQKARQMFQNEAALGQKAAVELPSTRHGNTITAVLPTKVAPFAFLTTGVDGRVEAWKDADLIEKK